MVRLTIVKIITSERHKPLAQCYLMILRSTLGPPMSPSTWRSVIKTSTISTNTFHSPTETSIRSLSHTTATIRWFWGWTLLKAMIASTYSYMPTLSTLPALSNSTERKSIAIRSDPRIVLASSLSVRSTSGGKLINLAVLLSWPMDLIMIASSRRSIMSTSMKIRGIATPTSLVRKLSLEINYMPNRVGNLYLKSLMLLKSTRSV